MTSLSRLLGIAVISLLIPSVGWSQTADQIVSCNTVSGPFEVQGSSPWSYTFTMAQLVPASDTDPTLVPHLYNGFIMQIDTLAEQDMGLGELLGICPNGTQRAGDKIYRISVGGIKLAQGNHVLNLWAWNTDSSGNKRGGVIVRVPFVASEPAVTFDRAPYAPINVLIYKGTGNPPPQARTAKPVPIKK
jgi:hypothetical protein